MADSKITDLADGGTVAATDEFVVARSGANKKIAGSAVKLAQSFVGYNTIGGTTDGIAGFKQVYKSFTTSADGLLTSIDAYCHGDGTHVDYMGAALLKDNAGAPGDVICLAAAGEVNSTSAWLQNILMSSTPRWLSFPTSYWLPAGTYWLEVLAINQTVTLYYDGSGGDYTGTEAHGWVNDTSTRSNSSRKYSIRGSLVS